MKATDCFSIGYFTKTHGYKGGLTAKLGLSFLELANTIEFVYLQVSGEGSELVPFFFESVSIKSDGKVTIEIEDITTETEAKKLVGKQLLLQKKNYPKVAELEKEPDELNGFEVYDEKSGKIGKVVRVLKQQTQNLLEINDGSNEIFVPMVDEIVKEVNEAEKKIMLQLPEGLLDIYRK